MVAFVLPAAVIVLYAMRGGSYDLVIRQELGLGVWWVLLLGLLLGLLPRAQPRRLAVAPVVGLVALLAVTTLGLTITESDERTVNEIVRVLHYAGIVLLAMALVDARTWRPAAGGLLAGAVLVMLLALGSRLFPGLYPADAVDRVLPSTRLQYPLSYWNGVAAFAAMTATLALGVSVHARAAAARALSLAAVPPVIAVAYLTYSRGGVVAVAVGLIALVVLLPYRALVLVHAVAAAAGSAAVILVIRGNPDIARGDGSGGAAVVLLVIVAAAVACGVVGLATGALGPRLRLPSRLGRTLAIGTGIAVLAFVVVAGPGLAHGAWDHLRGPTPSTQTADPAARLSSLGSGRADVWEAALDIYRAEPGHGTGPGTFEFAWNRSPRYSEFVRDAHSFYLEALAEEGWPGLLAGILFLGGLLVAGVWLRVAARRVPDQAGGLAALLAAFVVYLAYAGYDWMWELTAVSTFGLVAACIALGSASVVRSTPVGWGIRAPLALVALVAGLAQLPALVSTAQVRTSQQEVRAGNLARAMTDAEDAVASEPWAATPYVQRALLFERMDRLRAAEADVRRARELEPTNYRHPLLLARIDALQGKVRPALAAFRDARRLAPRKRIVEGGAASIGQAAGP